jgi:predicted kinase
MIICTGAPESGKTTYVQEHAGKDDLIYDFDALLGAMSKATRDNKPSWIFGILATYRSIMLEARGPTEIWVIATMPSAWEKEYHAQKYSARILTFNPGIDVCKQRLQKDKTRPVKTTWLALIDKWYAEYEPFEGEEIVKA